MKYRNEYCAAACALAIGLAGCAAPSEPYYGSSGYGSGTKVQSVYGDCMDCGTITSIQSRSVEGQGHPILSSVAGAIVGGVIGHQFGSGKGNDAATAGGAVVGAVAGHQIDKRAGGHTVYDMTIRHRDGGVQTVTVSSPQGFNVGDRVAVRGDRVVHA